MAVAPEQLDFQANRVLGLQKYRGITYLKTIDGEVKMVMDADGNPVQAPVQVCTIKSLPREAFFIQKSSADSWVMILFVGCICCSMATKHMAKALIPLAEDAIPLL